MSELVSIGAAAKLTGLSTRQIRYLERLAVIEPSEKRERRRLYDAEAIVALKHIHSLYKDGQSFAQIARNKGVDAESGPIKIGALAKYSGVDERLLRQFEDYEIIVPDRTTGGTRLYQMDDANVASVAAALLDVGVSFETLRSLAQDRARFATGKDASVYFLEHINTLKQGVNTKIDVLEDTRVALERAEVLIGQCANCPNRPNPRDCPDCPMEQHASASPVARLIWEH